MRSRHSNHRPVARFAWRPVTPLADTGSSRVTRHCVRFRYPHLKLPLSATRRSPVVTRFNATITWSEFHGPNGNTFALPPLTSYELNPWTSQVYESACANMPEPALPVAED